MRLGIHNSHCSESDKKTADTNTKKGKRKPEARLCICLVVAVQTGEGEYNPIEL